MKFVEWCELFLIGHEVIDQQHKALFEIANHFHESVNQGFDPQLSINTLNQLIQYAQKHFADEEKFIGALDMPKELCERHQDIHDKLITDIFALNESIEAGKVMDMETVEKFIREWLVLHILIEDQKYKPYLKKHQALTATTKKTKSSPPSVIKYP